MRKRTAVHRSPDSRCHPMVSSRRPCGWFRRSLSVVCFLGSIYLVLSAASCESRQSSMGSGTGKVLDSSSPPTHDSKANARRAISSVVLLVMSDVYGNPITLGSGFFVGPNAIATNFHVIQGSSSGYAKLVGSNDKLVILGTRGLDQRHDLAILATNGKSVSPQACRPLSRTNRGTKFL